MRVVFVAICKSESEVSLAAFPTRSHVKCSSLVSTAQVCRKNHLQPLPWSCHFSCSLCVIWVFAVAFRSVSLVFLCSSPVCFPSAPVMRLLHYPSHVPSIFTLVALNYVPPPLSTCNPPPRQLSLCLSPVFSSAQFPWSWSCCWFHLLYSSLTITSWTLRINLA